MDVSLRQETPQQPSGEGKAGGPSDAASAAKPEGRFKAFVKQFFKFGLVGVSNTAISYLIYASMIFFGCHYLVASITSFVISVAWSFYWNNRMVFTLGEGESRTWWHTLLKTYAAYSFTGLILNNILLFVWVDVLGISAYIAFFLNLIVSVPTNFLINKYWAFRKTKTDASASSTEVASASRETPTDPVAQTDNAVDILSAGGAAEPAVPSVLSDAYVRPESASGVATVPRPVSRSDRDTGTATYTVADVQRVNTIILTEIDRICRSHGLTYFLSEGTLLGAIRHQGAIPWDDDADISMPRGDFERFLQIAPRELGPEFELSTPADYGDRGFFDFIIHVNYLNSRVTDPDGKMAFYRGKLNHIHVDIFILDGATCGFSQSWRRARLKLYYGLSWSHRFELDYDNYYSAQKPIVYFLSHLGRRFRQSTLNGRYDTVSRSAGDAASSFFIGNTLLEELDRVYPKAWFEPVVETEYEGHSFYVPAGYEKILEELYGDWRELPPVEKRVPEHYDLADPFFQIGER